MIASALMEIPISLILIQIFHRQRPKNVRPRRGDGTLPYWMIYIAWAIIAVVILLSGFFIILYSMEWGAQKANRWLLRFFISFFLSLLLIQPVKVVIFSLLRTLKGKAERNHKDYMETYIAHYYSQGITKPAESISASERQPVSIPVINMEQMKRVTGQEKRKKQMRQDLFVYLPYMITLLLLAYRQNDGNAFHIHTAMERKYALDFEEISDFNGYWSWIRDTVVSNMYPKELYARYKVKSSQRTFISDLQSHRIGSIRIRQLRSKALQDCNGSPLNKQCIKSAVSWQKDTDSYSANWSFYNSSEKSNNYNIWVYQDSKLLTLPAVTLFGRVYDYGTGGYIAHLGTDLTEVEAMVTLLVDNQWMDMRTIAVFTEFFIYNPNVNLFCHVNTLVESVSGVLITSHKISVFRLKELDATLTHICCAAFIILTLYLAFTTVMRAFELKWRSLQNVPFWVNIFALSVGFCLLVVFYHRKVVEANTNIRLHNTPWTTEMSECLSLSFLSMQLLGILAFLTSIKIFGILGSSACLRPMVETMVFCSRLLYPFTLIFLVAMFAFGLLFWAEFGGWLERYSTLGKSMTSAVAALLGKSDFHDFQEHGGSLAAFLFLFYMFTFAILLLDLGILIVSEATSLAFGVQHEGQSLDILDNPLQKIKLIYNNTKRKIFKIFA
uniref:polycystin-1-like protein 2 n=1 Tax=Myxine glutinosa TaxID=7769 RepID=UPI00358F3749